MAVCRIAVFFEIIRYYTLLMYYPSIVICDFGLHSWFKMCVVLIAPLPAQLMQMNSSATYLQLYDDDDINHTSAILQFALKN